jgi:hypothetical protein
MSIQGKDLKLEILGLRSLPSLLDGNKFISKFNIIDSNSHRQYNP